MGERWGKEAIERVFSVVSDPLFSLNSDGKILAWNDVATDLFGYSTPEAVGESIADLLALRDVDREKIDSLIETHRIKFPRESSENSVTLTATHASGTSMQVEITMTGVDSDATICQVKPANGSNVTRDIPTTIDRSVYRQAIEGSTDLIAAIDRNEELLFANERYREFHGLEEPMTGTPILEVLSPDAYAEVKSRLDRVYRGETMTFEMDRQGPDEGKHTLEVRYFPLESKHGEIHGSVATMREITELKQRARSLRNSWESYQDLIEGVPQPIIVHDTAGNVMDVNKFACRFLGYQEDELLQLNLEELLRRDRTGMFTDRVDGATSKEEFYETECITADGAEIPIEIASKRIDYFGSEAILSVARDLSDHKAYERELKQTNARLEEFAAVVSQDLRNPLTVAKGWAEMARDSSPSDQIRQVIDSLDRMEHVIDYTLTLVRKGEGLGQLSEIDVSELVTYCWHAAETGEATLENEVDLTVRGDIGRVSHLFETIFQNCGSLGGPDLTVRVGNLEYRDGFFIDHFGLDIPSADRSNGVKSAHIGTDDDADCDLMVVQRIANAHGWRMRVPEAESTRFRIEFSDVELVEDHS